MIKLFKFFLKILEKISHKKINYYKKDSAALGKTAAKSKFGFWYVGSVIERGDIACGILENGVVEKEETRLVVGILRKLLEKQDRHLVFYDVGANTGYYGLLAAYLFKGLVRVCGFEPIPEHVDCLKESIKINGLAGLITVFPVALGAEEMESEMIVAGSGSTLVKGFLGGASAGLKRKVQVKALDLLWEGGEIALPDFIKIDVEGFEYEVLKGAAKIIQKNYPVIFYETIDTFAKTGFKNKNYDATTKMLSGWGYDLYYLSGGVWKKIGNYRPDKIEMFLCLHRDRHANLIKSIK